MKKGVALVFVALIFVAGCASPEKEMKLFVGRPSSELLNARGIPITKISDNNGGEIWTYSSRQEHSIEGSTHTYTSYEVVRNSVTTTTTTTGTPSMWYAYTTLENFYVGANGLIYKCSRERQ